MYYGETYRQYSNRTAVVMKLEYHQIVLILQTRKIQQTNNDTNKELSSVHKRNRLITEKRTKEQKKNRISTVQCKSIQFNQKHLQFTVKFQELSA